MASRKLTNDVFESKLRGSAASKMVDTLTQRDNPTEPSQQPTFIPIQSDSVTQHDGINLDLEAVEKTYKTAHKREKVPRTYYLAADLSEELDATIKALKELGKHVDRSQLVNDALRRHLEYLKGKK